MHHMSSKKNRRRRNKFRGGGGGPGGGGSGGNYHAATSVTLAPGEVPSDEQLEAEAKALDLESQEKFDLAKKDELDLTALQHMSGEELLKLARKEKLEGDYATLPKQKLVFEILKVRARKQGLMVGEGTLELLPDGFGLLRSAEYSYLASPDDGYVSPSQVRRFGLRKGQVIRGLIRPPKEAET